MKGTLIALLQLVIVFIGVVALVFLIWFPLTEGRATNLDLISIYSDTFILYGYAVSIVFFIALFQIFKLLGYVRQHKVFSLNAVKRLNTVKYCALILCVLIVFAGMYIQFFHGKEDDPVGFLSISFMATLASIIVTIAAGKFEKKLQMLIKTKSENG